MEKRIYRLTPALKDNLWGGERLKEYGKRAEGIIAESWEL
jgi:mannose-6-phosphate isomerase class I